MLASGRVGPARPSRRGDRGAGPAAGAPRPRAGALAVECRSGEDLATLVAAAIDDPAARAAVSLERAVLATLEGGCSAPIGALAEVVEG